MSAITKTNMIKSSVYLLKFQLDAFLAVPIACVIIGAGNGLVPIKHQAITWTNDDQDICCNMVAPGHNGLTQPLYLCISISSG